MGGEQLQLVLLAGHMTRSKHGITYNMTWQ
jgi:hypothetical protein